MSTHPLDIAQAAGVSQNAIADALGITKGAVSAWRKGLIPIEHCAAVERMTGGKLMRWAMRPDDWHVIWPELIDRKGAPDVPQAQAQAA